YDSAVEGDLPSAQMMLRIIEMRGRMCGFFNEERRARLNLNIVDAPAGGSEPRRLELEFVVAGKRIAGMSDPDTVEYGGDTHRHTQHAGYTRRVSPPSSSPQPTRIRPSPDDLVLDAVQPPAWRSRRGGFDWS